MSVDLEPPPPEGIRHERILACLVESMPSDAEIARARARFRHARAAGRRFPTKTLLVKALQGLLIGMASAATASYIADRAMRSEPSTPPPAQGERAAVSEPRSNARRHTQANVVPPAPPPSALFGEVEKPAAGAPPPPAVRSGPPPKQPVAREPSSRVSPPSVRELIPTTPAQPSPAVGVLPPSSPASGGTWERAAKALEARDWRGADKALDDLDDSDDAHTRDAAALARAQLWITQGRGAEVRATLERLAERGHTPLIRRRAAALLGEL